MGAMLQKKMAPFGLKDCPARDTQKWLSKCYFLTPGNDLFFEFREPRFLWGGVLFGEEVAASDF
jgi:hypothetical protein